MYNNVDIKKEDLFLYDELLAKQSQYPQYVINLHKQLFSKNGTKAVLANLQQMIDWDADKTVALLKNMLTLVKSVRQYSNIRIDVEDLASKTWSNYQSGLAAYIKIIEEYIAKNAKNLSKNKAKWRQGYNSVANVVENFVTRIDGTESLLQALGLDIFGFVRLVLDNSYFFDPEIVAQRHNDIRSAIHKNDKLPARWTENYKALYPEMTKDKIVKQSETTSSIIYNGHPVQIDKDNNYAVRSLIKNKFGYTVSQGQKSIIQYYKISHIWGEAYDPIKFTNLWNLVLVPAWANDLLDKSYSRNDLTVTFKQVIKSICLNFYQMKNLDWNSLMDMPLYKEQHENDMVVKLNLHGVQFNINWIEGIVSSGDLGKIKKATVTI